MDPIFPADRGIKLSCNQECTLARYGTRFDSSHALDTKLLKSSQGRFELQIILEACNHNGGNNSNKPRLAGIPGMEY